MPPTQRELLLQARKGNEGAACALWESVAPRMIGYATLIAGAADAEDVAQAVFLRMLQAPRRQVAGIEDVTAWLLRAARNEALNTRRAGARRRAREDAAGARAAILQPAPQAAPPAPSGASDSDEQLRAALSALPGEQHEAVWLHHCCGLTFDQLAVALDLPRSTAASRYRAGIRRLREALTDAKQKEPSHV